MATMIEYNLNLRQPAAAPKRPDPCADDRPACPACGGLQCLCRPRFFPGQLLTDEDLNRLKGLIEAGKTTTPQQGEVTRQEIAA